MTLLVEKAEQPTPEQLDLSERVSAWIENTPAIVDILSVADTDVGRQMLTDTLKHATCSVPALALDQNIARVIAIIHGAFDQWTHVNVTREIKARNIDTDDVDEVRGILPQMPVILETNDSYTSIAEKYKRIIRFMTETHDTLYPDRAGLFPMIYGRSLEIISETREREKMRDMFESVLSSIGDNSDDESDFSPPANRVLQ